MGGVDMAQAAQKVTVEAPAQIRSCNGLCFRSTSP